MDTFEVGDLVKDSLNEGEGAYGLGVVVMTDSRGIPDHVIDPRSPPGKRYDVYFNKFERIITFHGDYLEKV